MALYIAIANVKNELPTGHGISDADITTYVTEESSVIDDRVGKKYARQYESSAQKFPEYNSDPATPQLIQQVCKWLVLARCYEILAVENRGDAEDGSGKSLKKYYYDKAIKALDKIADDDNIDLNVSVENKFDFIEKYPDDETSFDRIFTNTELDTYTYL